MKRHTALALSVLTIAALAACDPATTPSTSRIRTSSPTWIEPAGPDAPWAVSRDSKDPRVEELLWELDMVRAACEFYRVQQGNKYPDFTADGWTPLIENRYLDEVPENPLSPPAVASKIIVARNPRTIGADVNPNKAGWVWNPRGKWGGIMYAAGLKD